MSESSKRSGLRAFAGLVGWLALSYGTAAVGATASVGAASFYGELVQPAWAPPSWLFGPVWTVLYTMMGVAAWLVWRKDGFSGARAALIVYVMQLCANALWSWLFFAWKLGGLALVEIAVLGVLIAVTIRLFGRSSRVAAGLLVPYLAWVLFAAGLNFALWRLNPGLL